jgi:hypothetical protein
VTHRKDSHGRGRHIHPDDTVRYRRYFSLAVVGMVLCGILPPLIPFFILAVVLVGRSERRRKAAERPSERATVLARGRREF